MLMAFTFLNPYVAMVIMGLAYSLLACALWPMVAYVIPERQLGTAYGMYVTIAQYQSIILEIIHSFILLIILEILSYSMQAIQNLGLAVVSIIAGDIVDSKGYLFLEVFFGACLSSKLF